MPSWDWNKPGWENIRDNWPGGLGAGHPGLGGPSTNQPSSGGQKWYESNLPSVLKPGGKLPSGGGGGKKPSNNLDNMAKDLAGGAPAASGGGYPPAAGGYSGAAAYSGGGGAAPAPKPKPKPQSGFFKSSASPSGWRFFDKKTGKVRNAKKKPGKNARVLKANPIKQGWVKKAGKGKPGKGKPGKKKKKKDFIEEEVRRAIQQDKQTGEFVDRVTGQMQDDLLDKSKQYADIAGQYSTASASENPTLNQSALDRIAADEATINAVGKSQQDALAKAIAQGGRTSSNMLTNLRAAQRKQHQQYARNLRQQIPFMKMQRESQQAEANLKAMQAQLAAQEFGLDQQKFGQGQYEFEQSLQHKKDMEAGRDARAVLSAQTKAAIEQAKKSKGDAKSQQTAINAMRKDLFGWEKGQFGGPAEWKYPEQQFRSSMELLMSDLGLSPAKAARVSAQWARRSDKQSGVTRTFRPGHAMGFYKSMVNRGVSKPNARKITKQFWPGVQIKKLGPNNWQIKG